MPDALSIECVENQVMTHVIDIDAARIKEEFTPRIVETHRGWLTDAITTMPHSTWGNGEVCVLFVERRVGCTPEAQGQTQYIFGYWVCSVDK